jgi:hypothetical protein
MQTSQGSNAPSQPAYSAQSESQSQSGFQGIRIYACGTATNGVHTVLGWDVQPGQSLTVRSQRYINQSPDNTNDEFRWVSATLNGDSGTLVGRIVSPDGNMSDYTLSSIYVKNPIIKAYNTDVPNEVEGSYTFPTTFQVGPGRTVEARAVRPR